VQAAEGVQQVIQAAYKGENEVDGDAKAEGQNEVLFQVLHGD